MANQEQLEILKQGVEVWNKWREDNPDLEIDLYRADLAEANLTKANLTKANLMGADFTIADLRGANLKRAYLIRADLRGANLKRADLMQADLADANLEGANLEQTVLMGANLRGGNLWRANLAYSKIGHTGLGDVDLSGSLGLETIHHLIRSSIGTDTIQKSKGKIPIEFLRGCGLSNLDIEYAKLAALGLDPDQVTQITYEIHWLYLGQPLQFYSCFISYNRKDQDFAQRLHDDLQENGVRCWFAPEDMKIGDQIRPTIDREIRLRERLLVILSENSIRSEWVGDEVEAALEEESASDRLVLFPVRLDDAVMSTRDDWAAKIKRRRHIGDFSNWQDERGYRQAFERLLNDLKAQ